MKSKLDPAEYGSPESAISSKHIEGELEGMTIEQVTNIHLVTQTVSVGFVGTTILVKWHDSALQHFRLPALNSIPVLDFSFQVFEI